MKLRIKNQLRGEIMVSASTHDGETTVTIASAKTLPPLGSQPIQMGDTEEITAVRRG